MCGGRGTRLRGADDTESTADREKPLVEIDGEPMLDRVVDALTASRVGGSGSEADGTIHAVVSPYTPATAARARKRSLSVIETPGGGYVSDLRAALETIDRSGSENRPVLTVPADLPLLAPEHVDDAIDRAFAAEGEGAQAFAADGSPDRTFEAEGTGATATVPPATSLTVCVPVALKRRLGASVDASFEHEGRAVEPVGLNVVAGDDDTVALTYDARLAVNVNRPEDRALAEALCE
ncbi:NTP transferase domain-containing protein [Halobellus captivus]|uniref:NTP transferase domain-containing protein n=1 Tax=Halobellus captivus TaxID=2592614 RepID=UPI00119ECDC6|nr:NTP transferase domain-containing protein [Halobellus captivus]